MNFVTMTFRVVNEQASDYKRFYGLTIGDNRTDDEKLMNSVMCGTIRVDLDSPASRKIADNRLKDSCKLAKQMIRDYGTMRLKQMHTSTMHTTKLEKTTATVIGSLRAGKPIKAKLTNDLMNYAQQLMF